MRRRIYDFTGKNVFIDWLAVEAGRISLKNRDPPGYYAYIPYGIEICAFPPRMDPYPLLKADKPWEAGAIGSYISFLPEGNRLRIYYEAYPEIGVRDLQTLLCYAEIEIGKLAEHRPEAVKPSLGLVEWNGSTDNNIIFKPEMHPNHKGLHGVCVFYDNNPSCPAGERYKLVHDSSRGIGEEGNLWGAVSSDGLNWEPIGEPLAPIDADTQSVVFWSSVRKKYVGFFRSWDYNRRQIYYAETDDFYHWPEPQPLLTSNPSDPPETDYYTNACHPWPGSDERAYIMLPSRYNRVQDNLHSEIWLSRDIIHWYRPKDYVILDPIRLGGKFLGGFYIGHGIVDIGNGEWALPLGVPGYFHNEPRSRSYTGEVHLLRWRRDGFTGLMCRNVGEFWTVPGKFKGNSLKVNAEIFPGGYIEIGIMDTLTGDYLPGYAPEDFEPIYSGGLDIECKWNAEDPLDYFDDVTIRLHFRLARCILYSFGFYSS